MEALNLESLWTALKGWIDYLTERLEWIKAWFKMFKGVLPEEEAEEEPAVEEE